MNEKERKKIERRLWKLPRNQRWAYVFEFQTEFGFFHPVDDYGLERDTETEAQFPKFNLVTRKLFKRPSRPPYDEWIKNTNRLQGLLNDYFREVFVYSQMDKLFFLDFDITLIIIPKEDLAKLEKTIKKSKLPEFQDFIIYLAAKIQKIFIKEIEHYESKEYQKQVKNIKDECDKIIRVVDLHNQKKKYGPNAPHPPELKKITFSFDKVKNISIRDPVIILRIMDAIVPGYNEERLNQWKGDMESLPEQIYTPNHFKNQYKIRLSKVLHKFFIEQTRFKSSRSKTPNDLISLVVTLFEVAKIPIKDKNGEQVIENSRKIKIVRNWINARK